MLNLNTLLLILVVVLVLSITLGLIPYLKKKGVPVGAVLDKTQAVVNDAGTVLNAVGGILPPNPVVNILEIIQKWAKIAVGNAEQLYHAGDIEKDDRGNIAEQVVLNVLCELGIRVDENKKALIDAAIKEAVNNLGHAPTDVTQALADKETLNTQVLQLRQENDLMKQTLSVIKDTIGSAVPENVSNETPQV